MRISKDPEQRKMEILDVAEELFTTKGYANTTVNDILKEVGIAKGTFYYYFQSKEEVMDAIVMRFIKMGVEAAQAIAKNPNLTAIEKLLYMIMAQTPDARMDRKEQMIDELHQVNNAEMHQKSLVETVMQLTPIFTTVIEQGIEEGVFNTPYPKETVEFLLVSQFIFDEGIFKWQPHDFQQKAIAFTHMIEKALGAKSGSFSYIENIITEDSFQLKEEGEETDE